MVKTIALALFLASSLAGADDPPACTAMWLRLPTPHELTYTLDPWTVMLLAEKHDPEALTYKAELITAEPTPSEPFCWVGSGPLTQGPVVVARGVRKAANQAVEWHGETVTIKLERFGSKITEGRGMVMTNSFIEERSAAQDKARKDGAKVF